MSPTNIITENGKAELTESEKFVLEKFKIEQELKLKQEELKLKHDELELIRSEKSKQNSQWFFPLLTTIIVALLTAIGAVLSNWMQGKNSLVLESEKSVREENLQKKKQQGELILQAIRATKSDDARENLIFLADAKLIDIPSEQLEKLRKNEGVPILPPVILYDSKTGQNNQVPVSEDNQTDSTTSNEQTKKTVTGIQASTPVSSRVVPSPKEQLLPEVSEENRKNNSFSVLDERELMAIMPTLTRDKAKLYLPYLQKAMSKFDISTRLRQAAFLANIAYRSNELKYWELSYDDGSRYENNVVLGNTELGDGKRFKPRGPFEITGRRNYKAAGDRLGIDLINQPELAATPEYGFQIAAALWLPRWNVLADNDDIRSIGKVINGLPVQPLRIRYYETAKKYLSLNDTNQ